MARRAFWPTVETSEATIFARGNVTAAQCAEAKQDCCGDAPPAENTVCCPDGFDETILFAASGPLGAEFATVLLEYELNWDNERRSWIGGTEGEGGEAIAFEAWCEEDPEFGLVWWIAGSYFAVALDMRLSFTVVGDTSASGLISFVVEVPGSSTPLTIVVVHPCPVESGGGGGGGGGTDPGGSRNLCGCTGVNDTLYVTFSGVLAWYGTLTITYVDAFIGWRVTPPSGVCNGGNSPVAFNCQAGTTWILSSPGSGSPISTSWSATATATSCSPLLVSFSGTATGTCAGAWTAVVSEVAP